jgi:TRAP-type C4-dicarboxylate transport system permease small subunit
MKNIEPLLTRALEFVLVMCLLAIATIVVTLVILRYLFNSSITGANELVTILFVYTTAIGAAVAIARRDHIAIPFAVEALPIRGQKFAGIVELVLVVLLNAVMVSYSIDWIRITGDYLMPATGLPRAVAQVSVPLGCGLAILYCLLRMVSLASGKEDAADQQARIEQAGGSDK